MNSKIAKQIETFFPGDENKKSKKRKWKFLNWIEKSKISKKFRKAAPDER